MTLLTQKYRRGSGGSTVHREDCRYASATNSLPWTYADFMTPSEMRSLIARTPWLKACSRCRPTQDVS